MTGTRVWRTRSTSPCSRTNASCSEQLIPCFEPQGIGGPAGGKACLLALNYPLGQPQFADFPVNSL